MKGTRSAIRRCASSEFLTADAADTATLGRVELGHKRRSFEEVGPDAKRGVIEQAPQKPFLAYHRQRSPFVPMESIWVEATDVASSAESPCPEILEDGNDHTCVPESKYMPDMMFGSSRLPSDNPARSGPPASQTETFSFPQVPVRSEFTTGADFGHVQQGRPQDELHASHASRQGDVIPRGSWQDPRSLREWVRWDDLNGLWYGTTEAQASMIRNCVPRGQMAAAESGGQGSLASVGILEVIS